MGALYEMWCTQCAEVHEANSANNVTSNKSIMPGNQVWVRKPEASSVKAETRSKNKRDLLMKKVMPGNFRKNTKNLRKAPAAPPSALETSKWQLASVLSRCGNHITVQMPTGFKVINLDEEEGCLPANQQTSEDMTELHYAHQAAILHNLKSRLLTDQPYTFIGNVLVSINPLKDVDSHMKFESEEELSRPHPRSVAERAFQKMAFAATQRRRLEELDQRNERETKLAPREASLVDQGSEFAQQFGLVNQSILISGESGSGKTEAAKRVFSQLVEREGYGCDFSDDEDPGVFDFQDNLIGTDPILESFGNAKTKRNPNSSRFGKFLKLKYEPSQDEDTLETQYFLYGASITTYLLERSRVTFQEPGEGNFRIFYQLMSATNDKIQSHLGFLQAGFRFNYINKDFTTADHDKIGYRDLRVALRMAKLGIRSLQLFQVVAGVLHLGNIDFEEEMSSQGPVAKIVGDDPESKPPKTPKKSQQIRRKRGGASFSSFVGVGVRQRGASALRKQTMMSFDMTSRNSRATNARRRNTAGSVRSVFSDNTDNSGVTQRTVYRKVDVTNRDKFHYSPLKFAAKMLGVKVDILRKLLLETQVSIVGEGKITKRVDIPKAEQRRDAMAKHIYGLLFDWLVDRMNISLDAGPSDDNVHDDSFIGILDVFGFEEFEKNSFEQLLINYANEVLLSLFVKEILIGESEIYKAEGLVLHEGELPSITEATHAYESCLTLFNGQAKGKKSTPGLLSVVDAQLKVPQPSDKKLLHQLHNTFKAHECFPKPHPSLVDRCFIVKHYASNVTYTIESFLQKNDQSIPPDMEELFKLTKHSIVREFPFLTLSKDQRRSRYRSSGSKPKRTRSPRKGSKMSKMSRNTRRPPKQSRMARNRKGKKNLKKKGNDTVCGSFSKQMNKLQDTLVKTSCSYIRCVKPNPTLCPPTQAYNMAMATEGGDARQKTMLNVTSVKMKALRQQRERKVTFMSSKRRMQTRKFFEEEYISHQLKNLGVYECVNVLKSGLPTRIPYPTFMLSFKNTVGMDDIIFYQNRSLRFRQRMYVAALMTICEVDPASYKLGKTKIFFRSGQLDNIKHIFTKGHLQDAGRSPKYKKRLLRHFTRYYCRKLWRVAFAKTRAINYFLADLRLIRAVDIIQRTVRMFLSHKKFTTQNRIRKAATTIQKLWRGYHARRNYEELRAEVLDNDLNNMVDDFEIDGLSVIQSSHDAESKKHSEMGDLFGDITVAGPDDEVDFKSAFSSVGEHNALRGTLQSYFNRRTTFMRKTGAIEKTYGEEQRRKLSKVSPENSLYSGHPSDEDMELQLLGFDGTDREFYDEDDVNLALEHEGGFDDENEFDSYDEEEEFDSAEYDTDEDIDEEEENRGGTFTSEETNPERTFNGGSMITDTDDLNFFDTELRKSSTKPSVTFSLGSRQPSQVRKRVASKSAKKDDSDENFGRLKTDDPFNQTNEAMAAAADQFLKLGETKKDLPPAKPSKAELRRVTRNARRASRNKIKALTPLGGEQPAPYQSFESSKVQPVENKLRPDKTDRWKKREPTKAVPVWQQMKLRSVKASQAAARATVNSNSSSITQETTEGTSVSRAAAKFGTTLRRVKKP